MNVLRADRTDSAAIYSGERLLKMRFYVSEEVISSTASEERRGDMSSRFPGRGEQRGGGRPSRKRKIQQISYYEETTSAIPGEPPEKKRKKMVEPIPQTEVFASFFRILEDSHIRLFLARDRCYKISDKFLLAVVLEYLWRARISTENYRRYFFPALFLANQMEEEEDYLHEIYPWDLGTSWKMKTEDLHERRNQLLIRLGFRAWVDRDTCDFIMAKHRLHWAWARDRQIHHSRSNRYFRRDESEFTIYGPERIPPSCALCKNCQMESKVAPGTAES
ncbi:speedy protein 1-B-like isoform X1 [Dendropsophus ebraccatus]|uniref:speedy protein 1-B-like isoform X1 n=1 Tax=Dendropsophus ebraccatus TaxID=150705 RepID=UPI0038319EC8